VLYHNLSLVFTFFPYIPSLLSHLLIRFFNFLALTLAPRALGLLISVFHRFDLSRFLRFIPSAFSLLRSEGRTMRLFPYALRPALCALLFLTMIFFLSAPVQSAQVTLQWDPNPEADLAGYKVYYGTSSGNYSYSLDVGMTTTCTVSNLQDGIPYYFAATAYDAAFAESEFSSEVVYGGGCAFSISPNSQSFGSSGGAGTISLSTGTGCSWTAVSNASWVIVTSNSSGSGSSTVYFSVASNSSSSSRSGTLTVAGKTFTVNQQGSSPSTFTINATAGTNGTISPQGSVTVTAGAGRTFTITPASGYAVSDVKVDGGSVGAVTSYAFVNVTANHTISASFAALPSPNLVLALNTGGSEYTNGSGVKYVADRNFFGGASEKSSATVKGTSEGTLYQDQRYGNFSYAIPVANGSYDLTLKFVETTHSARNQRVFDLWAEGRLSLNGLDIYAVAGKDTALDITFTVSVSDGVLNLDFMPSTGDAQVSAVLIKKASGTPKKAPGKLKRYFSTQPK